MTIAPAPPPSQPAHMGSRARPRRRGVTRWLRTFDTPEWQNALVVLALGGAVTLAMLVSDAAPTGLDVVDKVWVGAFTGVVAYFAGYARRWTWFLPAGVGGLLAGDRLALACAGVAIMLAFASVWTDARSRPFAALVAGLGMVSLQDTTLDALPVEVPGPADFHGVTAVLAAVAALPVVWSGHRLAGRAVRQRVRQVAAWAGALLVLAVAGAGIGVLTVADDLAKGVSRIDEGILAARDAEDTEAARLLGEASRHMYSAESTLTSWFVQPAHALPVIGPNIRAVSEMARDTATATRVTSAAATAADLDHLKFLDGGLEPRRIESMVAPLREVAESADTARVTAREVRSPWLVEPVRARLERLETELDTNIPDLEAAREAVEIAGPLIGGGGDRSYLVLFTTPVESRGRTGFPGNYAELTFKDGQLEMPVFGRILDLERAGDPAARQISGPADYLARYGRFDPAATWRNITMSPDFPTIAQVAMELYPQSGGREVDGVLAVDPTGLAALMHFTGPVEVDGVGEVGAENVERFLHLDQYLTYEEAQEDRVDFLEDVAEETFRRLTRVDLPKPSEVIDVLAPAVKGNHIQFTTRYPNEAEYFAGIGADGGLPPSGGGDVLAVTTTNVGPNKADAFLSRSLAYEVLWDPDSGYLGATATVTLRNGAPSEGLPDYVIGNNADLPPGYNRSYVSIYSAWKLGEARVDGQPATVHPERELGHHVYSLFVDIPPGESVVIELDLRDRWIGEFYVLTVAPTPLVSDEEAEVTLAVGGSRRLLVEGDPWDVGGAEDWESIEGRTLRWDGLIDQPRILAVQLE